MGTAAGRRRCHRGGSKVQVRGKYMSQHSTEKGKKFWFQYPLVKEGLDTGTGIENFQLLVPVLYTNIGLSKSFFLAPAFRVVFSLLYGADIDGSRCLDRHHIRGSKFSILSNNGSFGAGTGIEFCRYRYYIVMNYYTKKETGFF
jgi:hypothetical protein